MKKLSTQEILHLRDSQLNVFASLAVYAGVWILLQFLLKLADVDMPLVQFFDRYGNFSAPGIILAACLALSAFVPHWVLLRRAGLSWREGSRLIRDFNSGLLEQVEDEGVRGSPCPSTEQVNPTPPDEGPGEDSEYWKERWLEVIKPLSDEDRESRD
ncbi:hypothetical protein [Granulicoccus sp. GXG6511]|uniref:hypothetical protein n=1 Tax=Granulicoccus sp. GXG6511 TaxID=3381351 RepID=UPI003D7C7C70